MVTVKNAARQKLIPIAPLKDKPLITEAESTINSKIDTNTIRPGLFAN